MRFLPAALLAPGFVLGAFSFAVCVAFVPAFAGAATTLRWALLACGAVAACILVPYCTNPRSRLGVVFLGFAALSLTWTADPYQGALILGQWLVLAGIFRAGAALDDIRLVLIGAGLGMAVNSVVVMAQLEGWQGVEQLNGPGGLFVNRNYVAEPAVLVLIGLLAYRMWPLALAVAPAAILPLCRGALAAMAVAAFCWLWGYSRAWAIMLGVAAVLGVAGLSADRANDTVNQRIALWGDTANGLTVLGSGLGSFRAEFPGHLDKWDFWNSRPSHAHNDALEIVYELGPGALLLAVLIALALRGALLPERLVLIAFLTEGAFGFPLHWPVTAALAALVLGRLCAAPVGRLADVDLRGMAAWHRAIPRSAGRGHGAVSGGGAAIPVRFPDAGGAGQVLR